MAVLCKYSNQIPKVIRFCLAEDKLGCFAPAGGNDRPLGGSYENNASKSHYGPRCFLILNLAQKRKKKNSRSYWVLVCDIPSPKIPSNSAQELCL